MNFSLKTFENGYYIYISFPLPPLPTATSLMPLLPLKFMISSLIIVTYIVTYRYIDVVINKIRNYLE